MIEKSKVITFRVTEKEHRRIAKLAKQADMQISEYIRFILKTKI